MLSITRDAETVTIDPAHEPVRPTLAPRAYRRALANRWAGLTTTSEGRDFGRPVALVSTERQGFVTHPQALAILAMYEAGGIVSITTDLLHPHGTVPIARAAIFNPEAGPPAFNPVTPNGDLYAFEMHFLLAGEL